MAARDLLDAMLDHPSSRPWIPSHLWDAAIAPTVAPVPVESIPPLDDDLDHYVCCRDHRVTLCGKRYPDSTGYRAEPAPHVSCSACELFTEDPAYCPMLPRCEKAP